MVVIIIMLLVVGLFFAWLGLFAVKLTTRMIRERSKLRREAVIIEGHIRTRTYLPASRNHGTIYRVTYEYDYQGTTYSKQADISQEFYNLLGPSVFVSKHVSQTTPVAETHIASIKCVPHHPAISSLVDPTTGTGTEHTDGAGRFMQLLILVFGLFLFGCGLLSILVALHQLLLLLSAH